MHLQSSAVKSVVFTLAPYYKLTAGEGLDEWQIWTTLFSTASHISGQKNHVYIALYYFKREQNYVTFKHIIIHAIHLPKQIQFYSLYNADFPHLPIRIQSVSKTLRLQDWIPHTRTREKIRINTCSETLGSTCWLQSLRFLSVGSLRNSYIQVQSNTKRQFTNTFFYACQTICNRPGTLERERKSMIRHANSGDRYSENLSWTVTWSTIRTKHRSSFYFVQRTHN